MPGRPVERRRDERGEGAETWSEDDRKALLKIGGLFDKWNSRGGKKKEEKKDNKSFLQELGIEL
jgi:hypothetical protein